MTDDQTPPPAPRPGPTWAAPSGPPASAVPQGPYVLAPAAPKKRRPALTHGAVALVALFIGIGIGAAGGGGTDDGKPAADSAPPAATSTATAPPAPATTEPTKATTAPPPEPTTTKPKPKPTKKKPTKKPGPPTSFDGDGEYLVGEDIAAGTYKTAGPADDFGCYWERDKDSSGEFSSIIANDNLNGSGRVTVRKGEIFKTERCQTWKKVG